MARDQRVLRQRHPGRGGVPQPFLGHEGAGAAAASVDVLPADGCAVEHDVGRPRRPRLARQGGEEFVLPVARHPRDAEDLARRKLERNALEARPVRVLRREVEALHPQPHGAPRGIGPGAPDIGDLGADHHPREAAGGLLPRVAAFHDAALPQDRRRLAEPAHLVELVRDVEHRAPLAPQRAQRVEQALAFLRGQDRGRFVEDQEPRVLHQAAHDLDPLALAHRQPPDLARGLERQAVGAADLGQPFGDLGQGRGLVERERHVLGHGQRVEEREVLEHHADAQAPRGLGVRKRDLAPLPQDAPFVGGAAAVEHLDERGFARAVLAQSRVDLAGHHGEVDAVVGDEGPEAPRQRLAHEKRGPLSHLSRLRPLSPAGTARSGPPDTARPSAGSAGGQPRQQGRHGPGGAKARILPIAQAGLRDFRALRRDAQKVGGVLTQRMRAGTVPRLR